MPRSLFRISSGLALLAGAAFLGAATPARAVILVTYSTTGAFNNAPAPGTDPASLTVGGITITFDGLTRSVDAEGGTFGSFGNFVTSGTGSIANLAGNTFTLYITQTSPTASSGNPVSFTSTLNGSIQVQNSQAFVQFTQLTRSITSTNGLVTTVYQIINAAQGVLGRVPLNPPLPGGGPSFPASIDGRITATAVPEPATVAMALSVLPLLGLGAWRRRRARA